MFRAEEKLNLCPEIIWKIVDVSEHRIIDVKNVENVDFWCLRSA